MIGSLVVNWTKRTVPLTSCRILVIQVFFHMGHVKILTVFDAGISKSAKLAKASVEVFVWNPFWGWSCLHLHPGTLVFQAHPVGFFDAVLDDPKMWAVAAFYPWQGWWVRGWNPSLHMKNGDAFIIQEWGIPFLTRMKWNDRGILKTAHVNRE